MNGVRQRTQNILLVLVRHKKLPVSHLADSSCTQRAVDSLVEGKVSVKGENDKMTCMLETKKQRSFHTPGPSCKKRALQA